ncbi:helix-turn-helix transcriptional regulator [Thermophilibacter immobilis]|jgi:DNA-binding XRE family transcriptional regulator|uniref:Helix-turn-helix transcriptional regulator n=1 Tax=Thermophilibacter immobilis TaxID=2779519 RepID=A0A7S7M8A3_9ACTN|nr:helix-turn-helix transcriptional regulator [Thermophilibacter immobilis]QOY60590.1 helix-turn-helix transcriptional regulator [Thermophilibacter immobilis]
MSFRDNLQHLRAMRNMTQEQLAMLLGVSRQSVTKWEAEKSYPEMDKLIKICHVFDCSLDELVQGDLTGRASDSGAAALVSGPPTDVCGYDEHLRLFANRISSGVAVIIAGVALGTLADFLAGSYGFSDELSAIPILGAVALSLAFLIPAGMEHTAFKRSHPYVEDFYTQAEKGTARHDLAVALVAGVGLILVGCIPSALMDGSAFEGGADTLFMAIVAVAVWMIVRWSMLYHGHDLSAYNREALWDAEVEDIMAAQIDEDRRERLLAAKRGRAARKGEVTGGICGLIMLASTIVALVWLFSSPAQTGSQASMPFWLPWPIGGISCGVVSIVIDLVWKNDA